MADLRELSVSQVWQFANAVLLCMDCAADHKVVRVCALERALEFS